MPKKLSMDEKIVLIGLCKFIINSDGVVTQAELDTINQIADEIGFDDYQEAFDQSDRIITSIGTLQEQIDHLKTSSNKLKILKYAIQLSKSDALIKTDEVDILVYAADSWALDIKSLFK